ncbi:MAG TPA: DUF4124 domain-containing protein [Gammaproteobacteria bacterium]|nr:DUF4124 domain-containing protein [Gammaproteobacteria bacterium]
MIRPAAFVILLFPALLALTTALGGTLYKWVVDQGNVHYSDKPQPGATKLHLPKPTTYAAPMVAVPGQAAPGTQPVSGAYSRFEIASPAPEQTFWNVQSVTVTLAVQPGLQSGDTVTITVDGKSQGPGTSTTVTFDNLDRGAHTVQATLQEAGGGTTTAKPVTFYIQRAVKK